MIQRTETQLQKLWQNIKFEYWKAISKSKRQATRTGGGLREDTVVEDVNLQ